MHNFILIPIVRGGFRPAILNIYMKPNGISLIIPITADCTYKQIYTVRILIYTV